MAKYKISLSYYVDLGENVEGEATAVDLVLHNLQSFKNIYVQKEEKTGWVETAKKQLTGK